MLSKDLDNAPMQRPPNHICGIAILLAEISNKDGKEEATRVSVVLDDPSRIATTLAKVLKNNGYKVTDQTIRRHRRRDCSCQ